MSTMPWIPSDSITLDEEEEHIANGIVPYTGKLHGWLRPIKTSTENEKPLGYILSVEKLKPQNPKTPKPQNPKTPKPQNPLSYTTPKPQNPKTPIFQPVGGL